jgi:hypothetical protein
MSHPHLRLAPLTERPVTEFSGRPTARRVECPDCGKTFLDTVVVNDAPEFSDAHGCYIICRRLYCDHCNQLMLWFQHSNDSGTRIGPRVDDEPPFIVREKRLIEKFLKQHPEAAGMIAV